MLLCILLLLGQDSLQSEIDAAIREARPRLVIPAGVHRLPKTDGLWSLLVRDAKDLEIDARGAEFVVADPAQGALQFVRCRNVRLRGLSIRHETPTFTQGRVDAVDGNRLDVRIHDGYPADIAAGTAGYVFDAGSRRWKPGSVDLSPDRVERRGAGLLRLHFKDAPTAGVGDLLAFRGRVVTDVHVGGCAGLSIEDVTIRNGSGFCVHEDGGDGGNRYTYTVTYGPTPPGATEAPLLSCNADAFHSSGVRKGPTLENCHFEGMGDDGIPIHGAYALVVESREKSWVVTDGVLREGEPFRVFGPDGGYAGEGKVVSVRRLKDYVPAGKSRFKGFANLANSRYAEVVVEPPIAAGFDWQASNPATLGSGFVVRNNVIRNHRARGILIKADDGLIEGNTLDGCTIAGIVLAPELWWREACYSRNVVIRNNTIRHCGGATAGPWTAQAGVLSVTAETKPGATPGHRNIVIENNRFVENDGVNLLLEAAEGVVVKGNRFEQPCRNASRRGSGRGVDPSALIWVSRCRSVRFDGNPVVEPGGALLRRVGLGQDVQEIAGIEEK